MQSKEIAFLAQEAAEDKKAKDVLILEIEGVSTIADYFVICNGNSTTQVNAIADSVEDKLKKNDIPILRREGAQNSRWILLDYGSIIVHVFLEEDRQFYNLERLWGDAKVVER